MALVKRRLACPQTVLQIWDAIECVRQQRQITTSDRIAKYMQRKHNLSPEDTERQLNFAVKDDLVVKKKNIGFKGSKAGVEQENYRLPSDDVELDSHDWYCFECHRGGEVMLCSTCHRVYHNFCIKEDLTTNASFICSVCKLLSSKSNFKMKQDEMNNLLGYTCLRLKEKVVSKKDQRLEDKNLTRDLHKMPSPDDEPWRSDLLIFLKMDLLTMDEKTKANEYLRLEEFQADGQTIVHNVVIYYGVHSAMADMARQMLRDCIYDLGEIRQCRDCYRMSNEKIDRFWFCQPCDPPHELVYARQKTFPFWPAKVIRKNNGVYDVRFFGGYHQRANIEKDQIRPIETSLQSLGQKRSSAFNKAFEELKRHMQLLAKTNEPSLGSEKSNDTASEDEPEPIRKESPPMKRKNSTKTAKVKRNRQSRDTIASGSNTSVIEESSPSNILPDLPSVFPLPINTDSIKREYPNTENDNGVEDKDAYRDEAPSSSSQKKPRKPEIQVQEDNNVVTSSSQESPSPRVSIAVQTHKKLLNALIMKEVALKTNTVAMEGSSVTCNCEDKYMKMFKEETERMQRDQKLEKERFCQELTERLQNDFDDRKNKEISQKLEKLHSEYDQNQQKEEEQLRLVHQQDMSELQERLKLEISETKKKQWCYNCEQEAIYHCCWNTSYCSVECQQTHWHKEHKRTCRRKR